MPLGLAHLIYEYLLSIRSSDLPRLVKSGIFLDAKEQDSKMTLECQRIKHRIL